MFLLSGMCLKRLLMLHLLSKRMQPDRWQDFFWMRGIVLLHYYYYYYFLSQKFSLPLLEVFLVLVPSDINDLLFLDQIAKTNSTLILQNFGTKNVIYYKSTDIIVIFGFSGLLWLCFFCFVL